MHANRWLNIEKVWRTLGQPVAIIDLETTGGHFYQDRITEIAVVKFDSTGVSEHQWLVNPNQSISSFITDLTGISNEMVESAPLFSQIAGDVGELIKGCVLVAHNSRFDYTFLQNELRRNGHFFSAPALCTVQLSRRLYPQHFKHNLDSIIERFDLDVGSDRHRAMADVVILLDFLDRITVEKGVEEVAAAMQQLMMPKMLPDHLSDSVKHAVIKLPDSAGVTTAFDVAGNVLEIAYCERAYREWAEKLHRYSNRFVDVAEIQFSAVLGPVHALQVMAVEHLKHDITEPRVSRYFTIVFKPDAKGVMQASVQPLRNGVLMDKPNGLFVHKKKAKQALVEWVRNSHLCPKKLGVLPDGFVRGDSCPVQTAGKCRGDCAGFHDVAQHNERVLHLKHLLPLQDWPRSADTVVVETDLLSGEEVHIECCHGVMKLPDGRYYFDDRLPRVMKKRNQKGS